MTLAASALAPSDEGKRMRAAAIGSATFFAALANE